MFYVKARLKGDKRFVFLSPRGETRLRIHATIYPTKEAAEREADGVRKLNDGAETRVVPVSVPRRRSPEGTGAGGTERANGDEAATCR